MKRCALPTNWPCLPYGIGSDPVLSKQAAILPTTPPQSRATITIYVLHPYIRSSGLLIKILYCTRMTPRAQAHTHTDVSYSYIYMYMYPPPPEACWDKTYIYIIYIFIHHLQKCVGMIYLYICIYIDMNSPTMARILLGLYVYIYICIEY